MKKRTYVQVPLILASILTSCNQELFTSKSTELSSNKIETYDTHLQEDEPKIYGLNFGKENGIYVDYINSQHNPEKKYAYLSVIKEDLSEKTQNPSKQSKKDKHKGIEYILTNEPSGLKLTIASQTKEELSQNINLEKSIQQTRTYKIRAFENALETTLEIEHEIQQTTESEQAILLSSKISVNEKSSNFLHRKKCKYKVIEKEELNDKYINSSGRGTKYPNPFKCKADSKTKKIYIAITQLHKLYFRDDNISVLELLLNTQEEFLPKYMNWCIDGQSIRVTVERTDENQNILEFKVQHSQKGKTSLSYPIIIDYKADHYTTGIRVSKKHNYVDQRYMKDVFYHNNLTNTSLNIEDPIF